MMEKFNLNDFFKTQLSKSAKWAKFLAFFGFFIFGLSSLNILISIINSRSSILLVMLIIYISMLLPCYYLYQFSKKINSLIVLNNLSDLESAFENLSKFFHFIGIFVLVLITLSIFQIIMMY